MKGFRSNFFFFDTEIFPVSACGEEQDATGDFVRTKIAWRRKDLGENQRSHGLSSAGEDKVVEEKNYLACFALERRPCIFWTFSLVREPDRGFERALSLESCILHALAVSGYIPLGTQAT